MQALKQFDFALPNNLKLDELIGDVAAAGVQGPLCV
jgi:hypothetical protein